MQQFHSESFQDFTPITLPTRANGFKLLAAATKVNRTRSSSNTDNNDDKNGANHCPEEEKVLIQQVDSTTLRPALEEWVECIQKTTIVPPLLSILGYYIPSDTNDSLLIKARMQRGGGGGTRGERQRKAIESQTPPPLPQTYLVLPDLNHGSPLSTVRDCLDRRELTGDWTRKLDIISQIGSALAWIDNNIGSGSVVDDGGSKRNRHGALSSSRIFLTTTTTGNNNNNNNNNNDRVMISFHHSINTFTQLESCGQDLIRYYSPRVLSDTLSAVSSIGHHHHQHQHQHHHRPQYSPNDLVVHDDIYSFAVLAWEIATEEYPFETCWEKEGITSSMTFENVVQKMLKGQRFDSIKFTEPPKSLKKILNSCLDSSKDDDGKQPEQRPTWEDILRELKKLDPKVLEAEEEDEELERETREKEKETLEAVELCKKKADLDRLGHIHHLHPSSLSNDNNAGLSSSSTSLASTTCSPLVSSSVDSSATTAATAATTATRSPSPTSPSSETTLANSPKEQVVQLMESVLNSTFYRRQLPSHLVSFTSPQGKQLFRESLLSGTAECFIPLVTSFNTQSDPAFCGVSSLSMVLNALGIDPQRQWKGVWRWYSDEQLDCCASVEIMKKQGITFAQFACLATCHAKTVQRIGNKTTVERFRKDIEMVSRSEDRHMVVSFSRSALGQTGSGHFSPIGAYHAQQDKVLILDTARFKYEPFFCTVQELYDSMQPLDPETGLCRGYFLLSATKAQKMGGINTVLPSLRSSNSSTDSLPISSSLLPKGTTVLATNVAAEQGDEDGDPVECVCECRKKNELDV